MHLNFSCCDMEEEKCKGRRPACGRLDSFPPRWTIVSRSVEVQSRLSSSESLFERWTWEITLKYLLARVVLNCCPVCCPHLRKVTEWVHWTAKASTSYSLSILLCKCRSNSSIVDLPVSWKKFTYYCISSMHSLTHCMLTEKRPADSTELI